ncbi:MAG: ATP-binding protein, partial [Cytophagales bacterium]|nr:ATP-binding protein [Cytophagales bacterium]
MDYKIGLLGRVFVLALSLFFLAYIISNDAGVFAISLFIILTFVQLILLIRYAESSFKKVRQFLDNIKQNNYSTV